MFQKCEMDSCIHHDIPHGNLLIIDEDDTQRPRYHLGVVFSKNQALVLLNVCIHNDFIPADLKGQISNQIECGDLPRCHKDDALFTRVFRQNLAASRFRHMLTQQYFRHVAPDALVASFEKAQNKYVH